MDRYLRLETSTLPKPRRWVRALLLAAAVAGAGISLGVTLPLTATAQEASGRSMSVPIAADAPERYVVKKGDTLWDISAMYLKDPWYWPEIWYVNPNIANPHLIYPGDVLYFSYVDGKPRVSLERAGATRLSPEVRTSPLSGAIRAIPYDVLMKFVERPSLLQRDEIKNTPYVVGMRNRHMVGSTENEVYGRGLGNPAVGTRYSIINVGQELRDPDDGALLGFMGHFAGTAEAFQNFGAVEPGARSLSDARRKEDLTHLRVLETGREILPGDRLFPAQTEIGEDFVISAPDKQDLVGQIIAIVDGVYVAGKYQVLAINRGSRDGLKPGNALGVFYRGEEVRDRFQGRDWTRFTASYDRVRLPDERSASILLFRVYDRMSYGLVVESSQVIRLGDFVAHPRFGHRDAGMKDFIR
jgi:hypothetical protein